MITTNIQQAKEILQQQGLVGLPTETVYGLAGNAFSQKAIAKIFALKNRPLHNPLIVHIKSVDYLENVAQNIPEKAWLLAQNFWPGPLTLVLQKLPLIPDIVTAGKKTVAIRVPDHPVALELLNQLDFPLAAPSANPFGSISPTCAEHVSRYFKDELKLILDGGNCEKGIESTIIGFENNQPILYRLGSLSIEEIEEKVGSIRQSGTTNDLDPAAPGMLSMHYAPKTRLYVTNNVHELCKTFEGKKIGVLFFQNKIENSAITRQEILTSRGDLEEAAANFYAALHRLDEHKLDVIIAEKMPDQALGKVLNDRLERASKN